MHPGPGRDDAAEALRFAGWLLWAQAGAAALLLLRGLVYLDYVSTEEVGTSDALHAAQLALGQAVAPVLLLVAGAVCVLLALFASRAGGTGARAGVPAGLAWAGLAVPVAVTAAESGGLADAVLLLLGATGAVLQLLALREPARTFQASRGLQVPAPVPWQLYAWCAGWVSWCWLNVLSLLVSDVDGSYLCGDAACAVHGGSYVLAQLALTTGSVLAARCLQGLVASARSRSR